MRTSRTRTAGTHLAQGTVLHQRGSRQIWIIDTIRGRLILLAGGVLLAWLQAAAQTDETDDFQLLYGSEEIVSIATGTKEPIRKAPAVATVITAEDMKAIGARTLDDALQTVPGLYVYPSPLDRLNPSYSIRGIQTGQNAQVLFLINGFPITYLFNGARPDSYYLPVETIGRIEVMLGPGSAVYGADAFAGVINVITKSAQEIDGSEVGGRVGSFDFREAWVLHSDQWAGWDLAFGLDWQHTNGDNRRRVHTDFQTQFDSLFGTNASRATGQLSTNYQTLNGYLTLTRKPWNIHLWAWQQFNSGLGAGVAQALDPNGDNDVQQYLGDVTWLAPQFHDDWELSVRGTFLYLDDQTSGAVLPPGATVPIGSDGNLTPTPEGIVEFTDGMLAEGGLNDRTWSLELTGIYQGLRDHRIRSAAGVKYQKERANEKKNYGPGVIDGTESPIHGTITNVTGTPFIFIPNEDWTDTYLSVQDEWAFGQRWTLTAGVRYDRYTDFGDTVNPRLALVWETTEQLATKLLYGSGFRAPSFQELFAQNNPVVLGNSHLDPETIDTLELAFDYRPTFGLRTALSLFAYRAEDLIEFVPDEHTTTNTAKNARKQEGHGFEFEADWWLTDKLRLRGNYALQHSEDKNTQDDIPDAPRDQAYLNAHWWLRPNWSLDTEYIWVANRPRAAGDPRPDIDDYSLVNLTLRRSHISEHWEAAVGIRNLFNTDARAPSNGIIPDDYPLAGRSIYGEVRFRF
jgi:outer membrane receptor for ferrienterochelin and colicins